MKILNYDVKIIKISNPSPNYNPVGLTNVENSIIKINQDVPAEVQKSALLHEVIHFISERLGLDLSEQQVRGLEVGLFPFIISNMEGNNV